MQVGELFVTLGLKGADVVGKGMKSAKDGVEGLASSSLSAKAAIVALGAALEEAARRSVVEGTDLVNFSTETGIAIDKIGALKNEFRNFGSGAENGLLGTLKNIQSVITDVRFNEGTSGEFNLFKNMTGADPERMKKDSVYVLEKARELAHKLKDDPQGLKKILKGVGISDENVVSALMRGSNDLTNLKPGNIISEKEAHSLDQTNIQLLKMWDNIKKFSAHETVKFGPGFVKDLAMVTHSVLELVAALIQLGDKMGVFKAMGDLASFMAKFFSAAATDAKALSGDKKSGLQYKENTAAMFKWLGGFITSNFNSPEINEGLGLQAVPPQKTPPPSNNHTAHHASNTTVNINGVPGAHDAVSELRRAVAVTVPRYNRTQVA